MKAEHGNRVAIEYTGRLEDGTIVGSTTPEKPIEFTLGKGEVIEGVEEAVQGMETGEVKEFKVPPEKAFGDTNHQLAGKSLDIHIRLVDVKTA